MEANEPNPQKYIDHYSALDSFLHGVFFTLGAVTVLIILSIIGFILSGALLQQIVQSWMR